MSTQPTSGPARNVTDISTTYDVSAGDDIVSLAANWGGGTITLPGPATGNPPPNNGDSYTICDPTNALGTHSGIINGGGYPFLGASSALVDSAAIDSLLQAAGFNGEAQTIYKSCVSFTFDAAQKIWIVC